MLSIDSQEPLASVSTNTLLTDPYDYKLDQHFPDALTAIQQELQKE